MDSKKNVRCDITKKRESETDNHGQYIIVQAQNELQTAFDRFKVIIRSTVNLVIALVKKLLILLFKTF